MAKKKATKPTSNKERAVHGTGTYSIKTAQMKKEYGKLKAIRDYEKFIFKG